ncbi:MAG TPA: hypothetical protein VIV40_10835 [Kofleriaceae bacterium]
MIGPGWLPRYRPRGVVPLSKRITMYTRRRAKPRRVAAPPDRGGESAYRVDLGVDHGLVAELPVAALRPREARGRMIALVAALQSWLVARWQWLRPRSVPCAVAALGMIAVVASANYLAHYNEDANDAPASVRIDLAPR